jgi:predicted porin
MNGAQGLTYNRRSTVSLAGKWGELRLGRDYTPTFCNLTMYDPFGTVGSGSMTNVALSTSLLPGPGGGGVTGIRASNSMQYIWQCGGADAGSPCQTGGFFGQAMYAFGENNSNQTNSLGQNIESDGTYYGGRLGYGTAKWSIAGAWAKYQTKSAAASDLTSYNISGNFDFGFVNLSGTYYNFELNSNPNLTIDGWMIGAVMPLGPGQLKGSWTYGKGSGLASGDAKANQYAIGYVYPMSKRTALYGTFSYLDNGDRAALSIGNVGVSAGDSVTAFDLGVRHTF